MSPHLFTYRFWTSVLVLTAAVLVASPAPAQEDELPGIVGLEEFPRAVVLRRRAVAYAQRLGGRAAYVTERDGGRTLIGLDFSHAERLNDSELWRFKMRLAEIDELPILDLSNTRVTDGGLVSLRGLRNVWVVYLGGTRTTDAGVAGLHQASPKLKVSRRPHSLCYFYPSGAIDRNIAYFLEDWHSEDLYTMNEPSLWALARRDHGATAFRLLWSPSFHAPVAVRVTRTDDGAELESVRLDRHGYWGGRPVARTKVKLSRDQWDEIQKLVDAAGFWEMPADSQGSGLADGAGYLFEAADRGRYHFAYTNLHPADRFRDYQALCDRMVRLSGLDIMKLWNDYLPHARGAEILVEPLKNLKEEAP